jgi:hypothetical protein
MRAMEAVPIESKFIVELRAVATWYKHCSPSAHCPAAGSVGLHMSFKLSAKLRGSVRAAVSAGSAQK